MDGRVGSGPAPLQQKDNSTAAREKSGGAVQRGHIIAEN